MRPPGISFFAIMSILVISGCSANRNTVHRDRDDDRPYIPPRHDHDYSPEIRDPLDELQNPVPPVPSGEPLPAPPAIGISRIKSVSWLTLRGSKTSNRSSASHSACVTSDDTRIGECSPIESCTPQQDAVVAERVQRYREHVCGEGCAERVSPLRSFGKSFRKILRPEHAGTCSETCAEHITRDQASVNAGKNFSAETPDNDEGSRALHQKKKPRCLADSLDEPFSEDFDPGLITPEDSILPNPEKVVPRVPAPEPVPSVPTIPMPKTFDAPVQGVPVPPAPLGPSTQVIEPPAWPRLENNHYANPVSRSVVSSPSAPIASGQAFGNPQIIPGAHRRSKPASEKSWHR